MYRSVCLAAVVAVALCSSAVAASSEAFPSSCTGTTNNLPVFTGEPTLVTTVPNGRKYVVDAVDPPLNVLHVYGTPYEMGFARGTMMKDAMVGLIPEVYEYLYSEVETYLHFLPPSWIAAIDKYGGHVHVVAQSLLPPRGCSRRAWLQVRHRDYRRPDLRPHQAVHRTGVHGGDLRHRQRHRHQAGEAAGCDAAAGDHQGQLLHVRRLGPGDAELSRWRPGTAACFGLVHQRPVPGKLHSGGGGGGGGGGACVFFVLSCGSCWW